MRKPSLRKVGLSAEGLFMGCQGDRVACTRITGQGPEPATVRRLGRKSNGQQMIYVDFEQGKLLAIVARLI